MIPIGCGFQNLTLSNSTVSPVRPLSSVRRSLSSTTLGETIFFTHA